MSGPASAGENNVPGSASLAPAFDSHAHLDDPKLLADLEAVLARARSAGVEGILTVGTDLASSEAALGIARAHEGVWAAVGFHPHEAARFGPDEEEAIRRLCAAPEVVAVGEIGLDYHRDDSPRAVQREAFRRQAQIAVESGLPVVVHNREAAGDCLEILGEFEGRVRGVAHCFSGDGEVAHRFLAIGFFVSFAGTVTFPNARRLVDVAAMVPEDRILVETDCPYLAPQPRRGKRNEPAFVRYTLEALAQARGVSPQRFAEITTRNARALLL